MVVGDLGALISLRIIIFGSIKIILKTRKKLHE
jgi:hypothetical protein